MMDPAPRHLGWHTAARLITPTGTLDRSAAIARARQFAGAAVGAQTVGISLTDPTEAICAAFGAMLAGKPFAILDPHWPKALKDSVATSIEGFRIIEAPAPDAPFGRPSTISDRLICFTSGSTGLPKGVLRSHASWIESFRAISPFVTVTPEDTILAPGQLCHSTTLFAAMHGLYYGADVILLGAFSVAKALEATRNATILYATPAQLALMVMRGREPVAGLRHILVGGSRLDQSLRGRLQSLFPAAQIVEFYGATEASFITAHTGDAPNQSAGLPLRAVEVSIRAPDGTPAENGEIWVRSRLLFDRYICGTSTATRWQDGWLTIGETGSLDASGNLTVHGRNERMVTIADRNVFPELLESFIANLPGVATCAVISQPDPMRGHRLLVAVQAAQTDHIADACSAEFGQSYRPRAVVALPDWPLLASGKTDYREIRRHLTGQTE